MRKVIEFPELKSELDLADSILTGGFDHGIYMFDTFVLQDDPECEFVTFECDDLRGIARCSIRCLYDTKKTMEDQ